MGRILVSLTPTLFESYSFCLSPYPDCPGINISSTILLLASQILLLAPRAWFLRWCFFFDDDAGIDRYRNVSGCCCWRFCWRCWHLDPFSWICSTRGRCRVQVWTLMMLHSCWLRSKPHHLSYKYSMHCLLAKCGKNNSELILWFDVVHYCFILLDLHHISGNRKKRGWVFTVCTVGGIRRQL